jgi:hypothetical protein
MKTFPEKRVPPENRSGATEGRIKIKRRWFWPEPVGVYPRTPFEIGRVNGGARRQACRRCRTRATVTADQLAPVGVSTLRSLPQDVMRRAAMALRECGSSDIFTAARAVLEAAIRSENDLIELLSPDTAAMSALPPRADVVSPAG